MGHRPGSAATDNLCVLNDVRFFDLASQKWIPEAPHLALHSSSNSLTDGRHPPLPSTTPPIPSSNPSSSNPSILIPSARYAHLSSITSSRLFIIGGQDINNNWLDDVFIFELVPQIWVQRKTYSRPSGTYRSVAVSGKWGIVRPTSKVVEDDKENATRFSIPADQTNGAQEENKIAKDKRLMHLPYSTEPTDDMPNDIYLYSNYNVRLAVLFPLQVF